MNKFWQQVRDPLKGCVVTLAFASLPAHGNEMPKDIPQQIATLRGQVVTAVVIVGTRNWSFNRVMREKDLPSIGCTYTLEDSASIGALLDVLSKSQFSDNPTPGASVNARLGIYFYKSDGTKTTLIFARPFKDEQGSPLSSGDARGSYNNIPVVAKAPFEQEVRNLLVGRLKPTKTSYGCDSEHP
jgi:hypothetical protein